MVVRLSRDLELMTREEADEIPYANQRPGYAQGATLPLDVGETKRIINGYGGKLGELSTLVLTRQDDPTDAQRADVIGETDAPIFARVMLGWPGCVEYVDVDWINGTMVELPTPNISVDAVYPLWTDPSTPTGWRTRVGAYVHPGGRPAHGSIPVARRSIRIGDVGFATTSARVDLPLRAHSVALLLRNPTGPAGYGAFLVHFDRASAINARPARVLYDVMPAGPEFIPIETGIRSISVQNLNGAVANEATLLFALAL